MYVLVMSVCVCMCIHHHQELGSIDCCKPIASVAA